MAQIFHPSMNVVARVSIVSGGFVAAGIVGIVFMVIRSPYQTNVHVVKSQPVQFSHEHHVRGLGIECRYCHSSVEESAYAGMPPTYTCMSCHSQIWTDSEMLEPVRASLRNNESIVWNKIHDIPDYAKFNHSIHIKKGVGCYSCHGEVQLMPLAWKEEPMSMGWCLECHRNPEEHLRPADKIYDMEWSAADDQSNLIALFESEADQETRDVVLDDNKVTQTELGLFLASQNNVPTLGHQTPLTNCAVCHQ